MQATYAKALFEYGVVGTLAFGVLILGAIIRSSAPVRIRVATGVTWLLVGGNLADPWCLLFIYTVMAMWPRVAPGRSVGPVEREAREGDTAMKRAGFQSHGRLRCLR
jgi:hypothetical protein